MSSWDGNQTIHYPTVRVEGHPNWLQVDCGCCGGIQWGGEEPRECRDCGGAGSIYVHTTSGRIARYYPGGPFAGRLTNEELANELATLTEKEKP